MRSGSNRTIEPDRVTGSRRARSMCRVYVSAARSLAGNINPRPELPYAFANRSATAKFNRSPRSVVRAGLVSAITRPRRTT